MDPEFAALRREVSESRSPAVRMLLLGVGIVSTALGVIGIALPLLPTTPFLLLAAACFARSSERFYLWLLTNRWFGRYVRDWRAGRGIPRKAKFVAITTLWLTLGSSVAWLVPLLEVKLLLVAIGVGVTAHLLRLPTRPD